MIDHVLLEGVAHLVDKVHMHIGVVGIHLAAAHIDGHEHRLDAACGLRHQRRRSRGGNGQAGNVPAAVLLHVGPQLRVVLLNAQDERICGLALSVINLESTALLGHGHTRTIGTQRQRLMHVHGEFGGFLRAIAQSHGGNHIALGRDAHARTAAHATLATNLFPKMIFGTLHFIALGVFLYLVHDKVYLLHLQVNDVVHDTLCHLHMLLELVVVEVGILGEGVHHI